MQILFLNFFYLAGLFFVQPGLASDTIIKGPAEITARTYDNQPIHFLWTEHGYTANELIGSDRPIHIKLHSRPIKIQKRNVYQGAIGDEGPWVNVPKTEKKQDWIEIPAKQQFDLSINHGENDTHNGMIWPDQFDCGQSDFLRDAPKECQRWSSVYNKESRYVYLSALELKIYLKPNSSPEIIRIHFPGGC